MIRVVISAVNFTEGGPLTVLRDCLASAATTLPSNYEIIAIVNRNDLINEPRVKLLPIPSAKKSWLTRLYWEWFGFNKLSRELNVHLWLSLHDITPRVKAMRQVVYCHNPAPFYNISIRESFLEPTFFLFNKFYGLLYRIFIRRNHFVIVQQSWLRNEFRNRIGEIPVVVAHPSMPSFSSDFASRSSANKKFVFIYPALPRVFKNIEILCNASDMLIKRGVHNFEVRLTLNGQENRYAQWIFNKYKNNPSIIFIDRQSSVEMIDQYKNSNAVVFPSKLETWGLPISEAKSYNLPILVSDCAYARETVGRYDRVSFFPENSPTTLADLMESMIQGRWIPQANHAAMPLSPYAKDWIDLWNLLTNDLSSKSS
jgi:glycosyltransferase involved in cell wall biosynthesis